MKKFLALLLALVMCVGIFASCDKIFGNNDNTEEPTVTLEQAKDYLYNVMKDKNGKETPNDYDVVGKIIINNVTFDVTWTTDNANIQIKASNKASMWTVDLPDVNESVIEYKLTATIKAADGSTIDIAFTPKLPVFEKTGIVTAPVAGVAYKLFFTQVNLGRTYFATNTTQDNANKFVNAVLDPKEAADYFVEVVDGGYKIYTEINGVKNYLNANAIPKTSGTGYTKSIGFAAETETVFTYDANLCTFYVQMSGEKFGVGTYGQYETISISELAKHFKVDNINVKDGQFPMGFMTSDYAVTLTPDVIPPHVHEYVDGYCECGEKDPNAAPEAVQTPILTDTTLGLGAYADGTKTLAGVTFEYIELGTYGTGIQWRTKEGKSSTLWNTTATPMGIAKIEITLYEGKDGYTNPDAVEILFGNAADNLTYRTTLSTEKGVAKYTITPDADTYTFFKMTHTFDKTVYMARIAIYYVGGAAHEHTFVDGECACGEKDPNYIPPAHEHNFVNGKCECGESDPNYVPPTTSGEYAIVDAPVAGTAYKFAMVQGNLENKVLYLAGGMDGYYMATTDNGDAGIDVYLEETDGGYYLYTTDGTTKQYINMVVSGTHVNGAYEAAASTVYTYNTESKTIIAVVNDTDYWFGTRNDKTYTTVGPCAVSYNGFYCQFYAKGEITPPAHEHNFVEGKCECGETDPNYVPPHTHNFVEGKCECGETDPNYVPPHTHNFVEGKCECGETDPNYVAPHEHNFVEGKCECGETDPNYVPPTHEHNFVEGKCECGETDPNYAPAVHEHTFAETLTMGETTHWYAATCEDNEECATAKKDEAAHVFEEGKCVCGAEDPTYVPAPHEHTFAETLTAGETTHWYAATCEANEECATAKKDEAAHDYTNNEEVTAPTCTANGYTTKYCVCGATTKVDGDAALGHIDENGDYKCDRTGCTAKVLPADGTALTIPQALAIAKLQSHNTYTTQKYYITGIVTNVYNTTYGNLYLKDAEGNQICIYGLYSADGKTRYDAMTYKPVEGDELTVYTVLGMYNSTAQGKNAWADEIVAHEHNYTDVVTEPTCTNEGYTTHTCSICNQSTVDTKVEALGHTTEAGICERCEQEIGGDAPVVKDPVTFELGANGSASHNDGTDHPASKDYTEGDAVLKITNATKVYSGARDAKGNSCLKLGTSKLTGSFDFTVDDDVTSVTIYVAGYKAATSTNIKINGTQYTVKTASNNGEYTAIEIDTTTNKTISFVTVTYRCMINSITYNYD